MSGRMVRLRAQELIMDESFKASNGWLAIFLARRHPSIRRVTTTGRDLPESCKEIVQTFLDHAQKIISEDFRYKEILNMDETSIYLDAPRNYAI